MMSLASRLSSSCVSYFRPKNSNNEIPPPRELHANRGSKKEKKKKKERKIKEKKTERIRIFINTDDVTRANVRCS